MRGKETYLRHVLSFLRNKTTMRTQSRKLPWKKDENFNGGNLSREILAKANWRRGIVQFASRLVFCLLTKLCNADVSSFVYKDS